MFIGEWYHKLKKTGRILPEKKKTEPKVGKYWNSGGPIDQHTKGDHLMPH
jgi:hypothetical protein